MRRADWIVDVGPGAGRAGWARSLQRTARRAWRTSPQSQTARYLFGARSVAARAQRRSRAAGCGSSGVTRNNLHELDVEFPLACSRPSPASPGSGKSSLISQALVELVAAHLGQELAADDEETRRIWRPRSRRDRAGASQAAWSAIGRLVQVDQKPIGRTPRSNLATYTGLFDHVRRLFAARQQRAVARYDAGPLLLQRGKGRCETCEGEGFVMRRAAVPAQRLRPCPPAMARATTRRRWR